MLATAITVFFTLTLLAALLVIGFMFASYRGKIAAVVRGGLNEPEAKQVVIRFRQRPVQFHGMRRKQQSPQPLRAAA